MSTTFTLYQTQREQLEVTQQGDHYYIDAWEYANGTEQDPTAQVTLHDLTNDQCLAIAIGLIQDISYSAADGFAAKAKAALEKALEWAE